MTKAENKTKPTRESVTAFIDAVDNPARKRDAKTALAMMKRVTGLKPKMWGPSIIGFGSYHYTYDSGREGDMLMIGFSPRKANMVFYIVAGFDGYTEHLARIGKVKTGKSCLYLPDFDKLDVKALEELCAKGYAYMCKKYGTPKA